MRNHILVASAAALVACGGSTAPLSSSAPDASSDVAIDHAIGQGGPNKGSSGETIPAPEKSPAAGHAGPGQFVVDASTVDSSPDEGSVDAGTGAETATEAGGPFACGGVMCNAPGQYCSVNKTGDNTSSQCMQAPFNCDAGATCGCIQYFDGGTGCTCADNNGAVTLTCPY